jgi:hypothetical protein
MNRGVARDFHFAMESSSKGVVNAMWKLCMDCKKPGGGASYGMASEAERTDF